LDYAVEPQRILNIFEKISKLYFVLIWFCKISKKLKTIKHIMLFFLFFMVSGELLSKMLKISISPQHFRNNIVGGDRFQRKNNLFMKLPPKYKSFKGFQTPGNPRNPPQATRKRAEN
jgi:hypothetical protein